jgi:hypothetical protein
MTCSLQRPAIARATRLFFSLLLGASAFLVAVVACNATCPATGSFTEPTTVQFESSCGFNSFTSTCAKTDVQQYAIIATKTETCDVTFVLGDGTAHKTQLSLTQHPPQMCGAAVYSLSAVIDGHPTGELAGDWAVIHGSFVFSFGADSDAGPSTCKADAGTDASKAIDASGDSADAQLE